MRTLPAAFFFYHCAFCSELNFDPIAIDVCSIQLSFSNYSEVPFFATKMVSKQCENAERQCIRNVNWRKSAAISFSMSVNYKCIVLLLNFGSF